MYATGMKPIFKFGYEAPQSRERHKEFEILRNKSEQSSEARKRTIKSEVEWRAVCYEDYGRAMTCKAFFTVGRAVLV